MNLYLIERPIEEAGYDEYLGFVVASESEENARKHIDDIYGSAHSYCEWSADWEAEITLLGRAVPGLYGCVQASYKAGQVMVDPSYSMLGHGYAHLHLGIDGTIEDTDNIGQSNDAH